MSENSASAVIAGWGEFMNRAFETIKDVGRSGKCDLKSLVVFITTNFTGRHVRTPLLAIRKAYKRLDANHMDRNHIGLMS